MQGQHPDRPGPIRSQLLQQQNPHQENRQNQLPGRKSLPLTHASSAQQAPPAPSAQDLPRVPSLFGLDRTPATASGAGTAATSSAGMGAGAVGVGNTGMSAGMGAGVGLGSLPSFPLSPGWGLFAPVGFQLPSFDSIMQADSLPLETNPVQSQPMEPAAQQQQQQQHQQQQHGSEQRVTPGQQGPRPRLGVAISDAGARCSTPPASCMGMDGRMADAWLSGLGASEGGLPGLPTPMRGLVRALGMPALQQPGSPSLLSHTLVTPEMPAAAAPVAETITSDQADMDGMADPFASVAMHPVTHQASAMEADCMDSAGMLNFASGPFGEHRGDSVVFNSGAFGLGAFGSVGLGPLGSMSDGMTLGMGMGGSLGDLSSLLRGLSPQQQQLPAAVSAQQDQQQQATLPAQRRAALDIMLQPHSGGATAAATASHTHPSAGMHVAEPGRCQMRSTMHRLPMPPPAGAGSRGVMASHAMLACSAGMPPALQPLPLESQAGYSHTHTPHIQHTQHGWPHGHIAPTVGMAADLAPAGSMQCNLSIQPALATAGTPPMEYTTPKQEHEDGALHGPGNHAATHAQRNAAQQAAQSHMQMPMQMQSQQQEAATRDMQKVNDGRMYLLTAYLPKQMRVSIVPHVRRAFSHLFLKDLSSSDPVTLQALQEALPVPNVGSSIPGAGSSNFVMGSNPGSSTATAGKAVPAPHGFRAVTATATASLPGTPRASIPAMGGPMDPFTTPTHGSARAQPGVTHGSAGVSPPSARRLAAIGVSTDKLAGVTRPVPLLSPANHRPAFATAVTASATATATAASAPAATALQSREQQPGQRTIFTPNSRHTRRDGRGRGGQGRHVYEAGGGGGDGPSAARHQLAAGGQAGEAGQTEKPEEAAQQAAAVQDVPGQGSGNLGMGQDLHASSLEDLVPGARAHDTTGDAITAGISHATGEGGEGGADGHGGLAAAPGSLTLPRMSSEGNEDGLIWLPNLASPLGISSLFRRTPMRQTFGRATPQHRMQASTATVTTACAAEASQDVGTANDELAVQALQQLASSPPRPMPNRGIARLGLLGPPLQLPATARWSAPQNAGKSATHMHMLTAVAGAAAEADAGADVDAAADADVEAAMRMGMVPEARRQSTAAAAVHGSPQQALMDVMQVTAAAHAAAAAADIALTAHRRDLTWTPGGAIIEPAALFQPAALQGVGDGHAGIIPLPLPPLSMMHRHMGMGMGTSIHPSMVVAMPAAATTAAAGGAYGSLDHSAPKPPPPPPPPAAAAAAAEGGGGGMAAAGVPPGRGSQPRGHSTPGRFAPPASRAHAHAHASTHVAVGAGSAVLSSHVAPPHAPFTGSQARSELTRHGHRHAVLHQQHGTHVAYGSASGRAAKGGQGAGRVGRGPRMLASVQLFAGPNEQLHVTAALRSLNVALQARALAPSSLGCDWVRGMADKRLIDSHHMHPMLQSPECSTLHSNGHDSPDTHITGAATPSAKGTNHATTASDTHGRMHPPGSGHSMAMRGGAVRMLSYASPPAVQAGSMRPVRASSLACQKAWQGLHQDSSDEDAVADGDLPHDGFGAGVGAGPRVSGRAVDVPLRLVVQPTGGDTSVHRGRGKRNAASMQAQIGDDGVNGLQAKRVNTGAATAGPGKAEPDADSDYDPDADSDDGEGPIRPTSRGRAAPTNAAGSGGGRNGGFQGSKGVREAAPTAPLARGSAQCVIHAGITAAAAGAGAGAGRSAGSVKSTSTRGFSHQAQRAAAASDGRTPQTTAVTAATSDPAVTQGKARGGMAAAAPAVCMMEPDEELAEEDVLQSLPGWTAPKGPHVAKRLMAQRAVAHPPTATAPPVQNALPGISEPRVTSHAAGRGSAAGSGPAAGALQAGGRLQQPQGKRQKVLGMEAGSATTAIDGGGRGGGSGASTGNGVGGGGGGQGARAAGRAVGAGRGGSRGASAKGARR